MSSPQLDSDHFLYFSYPRAPLIAQSKWQVLNKYLLNEHVTQNFEIGICYVLHTANNLFPI